MKFMLCLLLLSTSGILVAQTSNPAANAGARNTIQKPSPGGPGHPVPQCGSITSPGNYFLPHDLTCPGTALYVSGPGIHLNLNGHTITYGTAGGATGAVYGIENDSCWDHLQGAVASPCDNKNQGIGAEIYGGSIVQSNRAPAFSHALFFGQNGNTNQVIDVHDLTITVQQTGTQAFLSKFQYGQIVLEHNTIYDNVKSINHPGQSDQGARSYFQGVAVVVDNSTNMASPDQIDNNKIIGSPQGGIMDTSTNPMIYQNDISQTATYANDFCIDVPGTGEQVYSNYCHPVNGRGIHVNGADSRIYNNDLVVTESPVNAEYGGCEGPAFGIQLEDDIQSVGHISITGNQVAVNTGACGGAAIRVSSWPAGAPAEIQGNTLIVNKTPGVDRFAGILYSVDNSDLSDVVFGGDTLHTTDLFCAGLDWNASTNFTASLAGCTAPYAVGSLSGTGGFSTFKLTGAQHPIQVCGEEANTQGSLNGKQTGCRNRYFKH